MTFLVSFVLLFILLNHASAAESPVMLFQEEGVHDAGAAGGARTAFSFMRLPDGSFAFYDRFSPEQGPISLPDAEGKRHILLPHLPQKILASELIMNSGVLDNTQVVLSQDGEVKSVRVLNESLDKETAKKVGLPRYLNTWINRAGTAGEKKPQLTWRGYNGSLMEYQELENGRLIVPHGSLIPHAQAMPPTGRHETVIQYSDDGGASWKLSESKLTAPCYPGFNGSNEGACEPAFEELADGRIWMLMRTTAGFLYESFSSDSGTTWTPARASRFNTSTGPPNIMRHRNGWLVVCWNNCEMPQRADGAGVYGGRDALHIAVSDDEGKTWRGFREIYLDHRRNENPAKNGDRGTAYPLGTYTSDGQILVLAGQGKGGRNPILIDPAWIVETGARTDFSEGLKQWSTYTHHGPAKRWWRARAPGAALIEHPDDKTRKCLHVRKQPDLPADGATWNFPNGWKGSLQARVKLRSGSKGSMIALNDRMFDPSNAFGEDLAVFRVELTELELTPDEWTTLRFDWDLSTRTCTLKVGDSKPVELPLRHPTLNGLSYIRLRSTAEETDLQGLLVEQVEVTITDPFAPACSVREQKDHEQRYVKQVVPGWGQDQ
ncbi:sialidase family protein [Gimesia sp.]|uniref:sialidase family protein n=1 Tax=Gimesia sp. TaxID=2024833 RepID=UPI003A944B9F